MKSSKQTNHEKCHNHESHPDHSLDINRINRIKGQLEGVVRMIEDQRYCPDILTQTRAIAAAVKSLEASILETHLNACVTQAFKSEDHSQQQAKIDELLDLFGKYK